MSGKLFKVCPGCNNWNPAGAFECFSCGTDLTGIQPVTKEKPAGTQAPAQNIPDEKVKICSECGYVNSPQARKCDKCGEDLSDIRAVSVKNPGAGKEQRSSSRRFEFAAVDGNADFEVPAEMTELIVGREAFLGDYLAGKMYVSRQQAAIVLDKDQFMIRNLSGTNPTFVDNQELEPGKEYSFPYGKEIGLGGKVINGNRQKEAAYLILRVKK